MQRDGFSCVRCGSVDNQLHVHHVYYDNEYKNPWDYPDFLLVTICNDCHELEHGIYHNRLSINLLNDFIKISIPYLFDKVFTVPIVIKSLLFIL